MRGTPPSASGSFGGPVRNLPRGQVMTSAVEGQYRPMSPVEIPSRSFKNRLLRERRTAGCEHHDLPA